ncbi:MAG: AMP-binding protein [Acidobacteria bacterium]|nr:AMP-binding protein [Acidobacteriota bacterium]
MSTTTASGRSARRCPAAEVKIESPDAEGIGEVLIRSTMVFKGYYNNPTANAEAFTEDGWFALRRSRQIRSRRASLYRRAQRTSSSPERQERPSRRSRGHYLKTPLVEELAIIGVEDESLGRAGRKLVAVVVPTSIISSKRRSRIHRPLSASISTISGATFRNTSACAEYIVRAGAAPAHGDAQDQAVRTDEADQGRDDRRDRRKPPEKSWDFTRPTRRCLNRMPDRRSRRSSNTTRRKSI